MKAPSPKIIPVALAAIPLTFLSVAGCTARATSPVATPSASRMCSTDGLNDYKGEVATAAVGQEIYGQSGAAKFRWLPKGSVVTMEYDVSRVNVKYDEKKIITAVTCG